MRHNIPFLWFTWRFLYLRCSLIIIHLLRCVRKRSQSSFYQPYPFSLWRVIMNNHRKQRLSELHHHQSHILNQWFYQRRIKLRQLILRHRIMEPWAFRRKFRPSFLCSSWGSMELQLTWLVIQMVQPLIHCNRCDAILWSFSPSP